MTFHYGFSAELGGGEYERAASFNSLVEPVPITPPGSIQDAIGNPSEGGVAEITDSGRYEETPVINLNKNATLELRAANEHRPTLVLDGDMEISGKVDTEVTLNGLLITGGRIFVPDTVANKLRRLTLRHCTLVPGHSLDIDGQPLLVPEPSLVVDLSELRGLNYYTGLVARFYASGVGFELGGGGRYDGLTARFGRDLPAVGFSLSLDRLAHLLERQDPAVAAVDPIRVVGSGSLAESVSRARELRRSGAAIRLDGGGPREVAS